MNRKSQAATALLAALLVGAMAQSLARREAVLLGLTSVELFLLAAGAAAVAKRVVAS